MISLKDSPVFKQDYARYQQEIKSVTDPRWQKELTDLLIELVNEVNALDLHHNALLLTNKLPEGAKESRSKLASIKKRLDAKLLSYKSSSAGN